MLFFILGIKKGGKFHVFGIYYDNNQDSEVSKQLNKSDESYSANTVLLRLSCEVSAEANQWIDMLQSSCRFDKVIYIYIYIILNFFKILITILAARTKAFIMLWEK